MTSAYAPSTELPMDSDFPISMADDFLPFPLSPSTPLPVLDPEEPLLNDVEQKYFSEFLDTLVSPDVDTDAAAYHMPPLPQSAFDRVPQNMYNPRGDALHSGEPSQPSPYGGVPVPTPSPVEGHAANWTQSDRLAHPPKANHPIPNLYVDTSAGPPRRSYPLSAGANMQTTPHGHDTPPGSLLVTDSCPKASPSEAESPESVSTNTRRKSESAIQTKPGGRVKAPKLKDMKRRGGRELLTEQEKRTNHIMSEQKRRNLIRQGFKALAELVPGLKGGNLGSSKSVILYNTVGFIRHLEHGNRVLTDQLGMLHKRYNMHVSGQREGDRVVHQPMPKKEDRPDPDPIRTHSPSNRLPSPNPPIHPHDLKRVAGYRGVVEQRGQPVRRLVHSHQPSPASTSSDQADVSDGVADVGGRQERAT
ncbi:hypothetical protein SpCBS45565_g05985 [Spizellomyces sp. 'palustris']|nr:hypothetical protein SpCBS45565_g05985 [Spizellomyces sp. 'palustris']